MRGRSIKVTILVLIILALSILSLAFTEIDVNVPGVGKFQRGSIGPLGLKLGLDLQGGAHLVYQAEVGTNITATVPGPANEDDISSEINKLNIESYTASVTALDEDTVQIKGTLLADSERQQVRNVLEELYGPITDENHFKVIDNTAPSADQMTGALDIIARRVNAIGTDEPLVQKFGDDRIIVQLPGASGTIINIEFVDTCLLYTSPSPRDRG